MPGVHRKQVSRILIAISYLSSAAIVLWLLARARALTRERRFHPSDLLLATVVLLWVVKNFILQPFIVTSASMEPTLAVREIFLVSHYSYWFQEPARGDIVVFRSKALGNRDLVKRILAIPGDSLVIREGHCRLNGKVVEGLDFAPQFELEFPEIPAGEYFVLGDNVSNSRDSRAYGTVKRRWIVGKAWRSLWPLNRSRPL